MSTDPMGDRMKSYEAVEAGRRFIPLLPVYARLDGRSFSRFTEGLDRPFDTSFSGAMVQTASRLVAETNARIAYTQSDEISLVWVQDRFGAEMFFDGRVQKMVSVLSGLATAFFHLACRGAPALAERLDRLAPHFDCRVFQLPNRVEAANAFLWRERDATKNAVSMAARAYYTPEELYRKRAAEMQEMLFARGINFNDYPAFFKRGTFVRRQVVARSFTDEERARIPERHRPGPDDVVERMAVVTLDIPSFATVVNREAVIFDGAQPETARATSEA